MQKLVLTLLGLGVGLILGGCATTEPAPVGPVSEESDMPWNTPQPGEGGSAFGGMLDQGRR
ncbi:MAG: hypothetical protein O3A92_11790 [Verrucomicrobia bacterium]|nr:hypothetical protein [Verrucomicrobiota bacterium]